jgi:hypothetical protein
MQRNSRDLSSRQPRRRLSRGRLQRRPRRYRAAGLAAPREPSLVGYRRRGRRGGRGDRRTRCGHQRR